MTTGVPAPTQTISDLIDDSKRKYGAFSALKHKKFWAAICAGSVPWVFGYQAMPVDGLLGFWFVALGVIPFVAYILAQGYVDGKEKQALRNMTPRSTCRRSKQNLTPIRKLLGMRPSWRRLNRINPSLIYSTLSADLGRRLRLNSFQHKTLKKPSLELNRERSRTANNRIGRIYSNWQMVSLSRTQTSAASYKRFGLAGRRHESTSECYKVVPQHAAKCCSVRENASPTSMLLKR